MSRTINAKFALSNFFFYFAVATVFYILLKWNSIPDDSKLIIFLPTIFGLYIRFSLVKYYNSIYFSLSFFNFLTFAKYVILPLAMVINDNFFVFSWMNKPDMSPTYILMIYDLIWIIISVNFFCSWLQYYEVKISSQKQSLSNVVYFIAIIIGLIGLLYQPAFINKLIFFSKRYKNYAEDNSMFNEGGLSALLFYFIIYIQVLFFIIIIKSFIKKNGSRNPYIILSIILVSLLNCALVWTSNRASVLTTVLITSYIVYLIFPQKKKLITGSFIFVGFLVIVSLTSYRYFNKFNIQSAKNTEVFKNFGIKGAPFLLDTYVSGPTSVAVGQHAMICYEQQITTQTFISDIFVSTLVVQPILTKNGIDVFKTTSSYLNKYTNRNLSLIIPLICQGSLYLGYIFSPLFCVMAIFFMLKCEINSKKDGDVGMKYIWLLLALRFACMPGYSLPVLVRSFSIDFLPLYLIIYVNNRFSKLFNRHKSLSSLPKGHI